MEQKERKLEVWERYLTLWFVLCIAAGTASGRFFPQISPVLARLEIANVSIPIAICLFAMLHLIMVQIDFS